MTLGNSKIRTIEMQIFATALLYLFSRLGGIRASPTRPGPTQGPSAPLRETGVARRWQRRLRRAGLRLLWDPRSSVRDGESTVATTLKLPPYEGNLLCSSTDLLPQLTKNIHKSSSAIKFVLEGSFGPCCSEVNALTEMRSTRDSDLSSG